jgi:GH25 family lysozyme M1 (1,4-beta-N-acetylmuramidase)
LPPCTRHGISTIKSNTEPSDRELQFLEYVQLLILNAQVYDAGRKNCSKSSKLDVNLMDLAFDEIKTDEMVHEINKHDIDPTYGQLEVNVNDTKHSSTRSSAIMKTGPRKVFVDCDTWRSLSQANQTMHGTS